MKLALTLFVGVAIGGAAVHGLHAQAKPPAFLIFESDIKDRAAYEPHRQTSAKELLAAGAKYLALGAEPVVLEGDPPKRITISQWKSIDDIKKWHTAPAMKEANEARAKYTLTRLYAVEGKPD